jgi:hypothetical protein
MLTEIRFTNARNFRVKALLREGNFDDIKQRTSFNQAKALG